MSLTPSQRVLIMKELAKRLGAEEYPLIDVTLKQFSLPWSDRWEDSKEAYVLSMIEDASDQSLTDLALHVGYEFAPAASRVDPPFWRKGMFRLFISHLATHRDSAASLQEALLLYGISGFVAHNDIEPTSEWQTQIETALATCDAMVAFLNEGFHESNWTDQEIGFAMGRGIPVFSVRFNQDPYGFIGRFQAFNGNGKSSEDLARELFNSYRKNKQTERRMAEVLVSLFEESYSFANAKTNMGYLEELEVWEPSFSTRVRSATKDNSQIRGSWGVPDRVETLLKIWAKRGV
jgi:nucleoside 2-deoxyribosyltransferase